MMRQTLRPTNRVSRTGRERLSRYHNTSEEEEERQEDVTPLEKYIRRRFEEMANNVRRERESLRELLERREREQAYKDYISSGSRTEDDDISDLEDNRPSSRRESARRRLSKREDEYEPNRKNTDSDYGLWAPSYGRRPDQPIRERHHDYNQFSEDDGITDDLVDARDIENEFDEDAQLPIEVADAKARPRYQVPTASARIRQAVSQRDWKRRLSKDIPAHEAVYPMPLQIAARWGVSY